MSRVCVEVRLGGGALVRVGMPRRCTLSEVTRSISSACAVPSPSFHLTSLTMGAPVRDDVDWWAVLERCEKAQERFVAVEIKEGAAPAAPTRAPKQPIPTAEPHVALLRGAAASPSSCSSATPPPAAVSHAARASSDVTPTQTPTRAATSHTPSPTHASTPSRVHEVSKEAAVGGSPTLARLAAGEHSPSVLSPSTAGDAARTTSPTPPKFCPECGARSGGAKFCGECGNRLVPSVGGRSPAAADTASTPLRTATPAAGQRSPSSSSPASTPPTSGSVARTTSDSRTCPQCSKPLKKQSGVKVDGVRYHKACFVCQFCTASLIGQGFTMHRDKPVCRGCFDARLAQKCHACGKAVTTSYLKVDGHTYHDTCFKCAKCTSPIRGAFVRTEGGFRCPSCG